MQCNVCRIGRGLFLGVKFVSKHGLEEFRNICRSNQLGSIPFKDSRKLFSLISPNLPSKTVKLNAR